MPGLQGDHNKGETLEGPKSLSKTSDTIPKHKSGKARIATALPMGSRKTLHPADNRHCASSAKNSDENQVAATQRKAKTNSREQGKSDQLP